MLSYTSVYLDEYDVLERRTRDPKYSEFLSRYIPQKNIIDKQFLAVRSEFNKIGEVVFRQELSDDERGRRRYRSTDNLFPEFGPVWGCSLTLGIRLLGKRGRDVLKTLELLNIRNVKHSDVLSAGLKKLSDYAKKWGELGISSWKDYVGLELQGGFHPDKDIGDFYPDIVDWAYKEADNRVNRVDLREGVRQALAVGTYDFDQTIDEYCDLYDWARPGASTGKRAVVMIDGKESKPRKSKNGTAMAMSPEQIKEQLLSWKKQHNKAIQKRELGKVRAIVNSNNELYLQMDYVDQFLQHGLRGTEWSTLYYSSKQMYSLWEQMGQESLNPGLIKLPLDQSQFDHQAQKDMILIVNEELERLIAMRCRRGLAKDDYLRIMARIKYSLDGGVVEVGDREVEYRNGVMSGWKWTAFYDSIINQAEVYAGKCQVERWKGSSLDIGSVVQGDDSKLKLRSWSEALLMILGYNKANIEINPSKFFVSDNRDEYLRQVAENGRVCGYVWRAIPSIFFRNPVNRDPPAGDLRAREQVAGWMGLVGRGCDFEKVFPRMCEDIARGNQLPVQDVKRWLYTSVAFGGGGLGDMQEGLGLTSAQREYANVSLPISRNNGLVYLTRKFHLDPSIVESEMLKRLEFGKKAKMVELRRAEFIPVKEEMLPAMKRSGRTIPAVPAVNSDIPPWIQPLVLQTLIKRRDYRAITEYYIAPEHRVYSADLEVRASRRFWLLWCEGGVRLALPVVPGSSQLETAIRLREQEGFLNWALARSQPTIKSLQRAQCYAAASARASFRERPSVHGG